MNISSHTLVELARWMGRHPADLVCWEEGVAAMKTAEGTMLITPPRRRLASLRSVDILELSHGKLLEAVKTESGGDLEIYKSLAAARLRPGDPTPSSIAFLLAYLLSFDGMNVVAHTHPGRVNQILCSPRARQFSDRRILPEEILACGPAAVLVPHCDTLLELARETRRKIALWQDRYRGSPRVILLTNNGMLVLGASVDEVRRVTEMTIRAAETFVGAAILGGPVFLTPGNVTKIENWK